MMEIRRSRRGRRSVFFAVPAAVCFVKERWVNEYRLQGFKDCRDKRECCGAEICQVEKADERRDLGRFVGIM